MSNSLRRIVGTLVVLVVGTTLLAQAPPGQFRVTFQLSVPADHVKAAILRADGTVFLATTAGLSGPSQIQLIDADGTAAWTRSLPSRVFAAESRQGRALIAEQGGDETVYFATVVNLVDGATLRRFRVSGDRVTTLTAAGDAVVSYNEPLQAAGTSFGVARVQSNEAMELTSRGEIASVHGSDFDHVFVLHSDGTLDGFVKGVRRWTTAIGPSGGLSPLQVTPDGRQIVASTPGGGFAVIAARDGSLTLRHDPSGGAAAIDRLGLGDSLKQSVDKRKSRGISASAVAANLKPVVSDDGTIRLVDDSLNVLGSSAILNPASGRALVDKDDLRIREYLANTQFVRPEDSRQVGGRARIQTSARGDAAVVVLEDRVLIVRRTGR